MNHGAGTAEEKIIGPRFYIAVNVVGHVATVEIDQIGSWFDRPRNAGDISIRREHKILAIKKPRNVAGPMEQGKISHAVSGH